MPKDLLAAGGTDVEVFRQTRGACDQWGRCVSTGHAQSICKGPEVSTVMRMDDVGDFVPECVQRFRDAIFAVRLPAHRDPVQPWLVVSAIRLARGDDYGWYLKASLEILGVQPGEFLGKHFSQSLLFRVVQDRWFHRLRILAQVVWPPA